MLFVRKEGYSTLILPRKERSGPGGLVLSAQLGTAKAALLRPGWSTRGADRPAEGPLETA